MGLAFIPLYIRFLGIEAYGLIGLFALLQAWLSLLDMGLTPTLGREMARFTGGSRSAESIRDLLRSIEFIALAIALVGAAAIFLGSGWIATSWIKADAMPTQVVAQAFAIMGLVAALRFAEGVYRSTIIGLQRHVLFNWVISAMATLRGLGAIGVLAWVSPTIQAFFIWQGLVSIATLAILGAATYRALPRGSRSGRFSMPALRGVWRFAGGMVGITFLALLLTQVDKILLSKLLTLSEYGYYTLAAIAAAAIYTLTLPITQSWYPRLCELHALEDRRALVETYHQGAQLVAVVAGSAGLVLVIYAETILQLWTQDGQLAERVAPLLRLLALGNLLHGLMGIPYYTQLAYGWTSLSIRINLVAIALVIPALLWITPRFGAEGAALVWVSLTAGYVVLGAHFMYRKILEDEKWAWYWRDVIKPLAAALAVIGLVKLAVPDPEAAGAQALLLLVVSAGAFGAAIFAAGLVRQEFLVLVRNRFREGRLA